MSDSNQIIINVQTISWMKKMDATNSDHLLFFVGRVTNMKDTLMVADDKDKQNKFFCEKHHYVYGLRDQCAECLTQALDVDLGVGATARSTP